MMGSFRFLNTFAYPFQEHVGTVPYVCYVPYIHGYTKQCRPERFQSCSF